MHNYVTLLLKTILPLSVLLLASTSTVLAEAKADSKPASQPAKPTLAVVDFSVVGDVGIKQAGRAVSELLLQEFSANRFTLLERTALAALLDEKDLSISQVAKDPGMLSGKRLKEVKYLVVGSVVKLADLTISARIVDATSGQIVSKAKVSARSIRGLQDALGELAEKLTTFGKTYKTVTLLMISPVEGVILFNGKIRPIGPKTHAVFTDVPTDEPMKLTLTCDEQYQNFTLDLTGTSSPKVYGACYPNWSQLTDVGSGTLNPDQLEGLAKGQWSPAAKRSALIAATADAIRRLGERAASQALGKSHVKRQKLAGKTFTTITKLAGVLSSSRTKMADDFIADTDALWLRVPQGINPPLSIRVRDFAMVHPDPTKDPNLLKQLSSSLKKQGITLKGKIDPKDYIANVTAKFQGIIIIQDYRLGF